jgi:hypothetical protein
MWKKAEGRDEMAKVRLTPIVASMIAITLVIGVLHYCVAPVGYFALREACEKEGGLRIGHTDYVEGYWHAPFDELDGCDACLGEVARGNFRYVEFGPIANEQGSANRFVKFELAPAGSESCLPRGHFETPPAGTCVAQVNLTGGPQSRYYVKTNVKYLRKSYGVTLRAFQRSIFDRQSKSNAATFHHFEYGTPAERAGNFAWSYNCPYSTINPYSDDAFIRRVLRDVSARQQGNSK